MRRGSRNSLGIKEIKIRTLLIHRFALKLFIIVAVLLLKIMQLMIHLIAQRKNRTSVLCLSQANWPLT